LDKGYAGTMTFPPMLKKKMRKKIEEEKYPTRKKKSGWGPEKMEFILLQVWKSEENGGAEGRTEKTSFPREQWGRLMDGKDRKRGTTATTC